jgi:membrane protease YdiL (CAAX protease family)
MTAFVLLAFGIGWPALIAPLLAGIPVSPFLLLLVFVALLGPALVVTRIADGPGAGRALLARARIWRFGVGRWLSILFGVPVLTIAIAAVTGTLDNPESGWISVTAWYLFSTLIWGALMINIWEEAAWGGFAQSRLMARHGLLVASLLTAPLFAAIHVPLFFEGDVTWSNVAYNFALLFAAAPFYRYLLGMHLLDTGGSILAIGIQHAAWNAAGSLDPVQGEWQVVAAAALFTVLVAAARRVGTSTSRPIGVEAEKAAAGSWIEGPPSQPSVSRDSGLGTDPSDR